MNPIVVENLHSPLGPSSSERWMGCAGSTLLIRGVPDKSSQYASEGTAAHTVSEWARNEERSAHYYIGRQISIDGFTFTVDKEMADAVDVFVEYCNGLPGDPFYEARVYYNEWVENGFGTMDDGRVSDGICYVTDFKYGKGVQVFAHDNSQLKLYALGLYHDYRHLYEFDRFELAIVQPRLDHIDTFSIALEDLLTWANDVVAPAALLALTPGAPLNAGDHCKFCPIRATCRTRAEWVHSSILGEFDNLDLPSPPQVELLSNDEIANILPKISAVRQWCSDLEDHARSEVVQGRDVGGWKLVAGRSNRVYVGGEEDIAKALSAHLTEEQMWERTLISPTKAEKLLGKKHPVLGTLIRKPEGAPKLAPPDDRRPSISINASTEFENLEEEAC